MKVALPKSRWSYLVSAMLAVGFASQAVAEPCPAECVVTLGGTTVKVEASQPGITDDGFGFKTKYQNVGPFTLPLNGGMTQWQTYGRNVMFAESFWYRIGPAGPANSEQYWVDNTGPLQGTQGVLPGGTVGRIAATTEGGLVRPGGVKLNASFDVTNTPGGSLINEKLQVINTTDALITLFAYTDLDISNRVGGGDRATGQFNGQNAEILQTDETGHVKVKVTGLGASGFEMMYLGGRTVENGGTPALLDLLNRPELAADFLNVGPESLSALADVTHVIQWSNIELPAFGSREIALVKEFSVPEPGSLALLMAPLLAGMGLMRGRGKRQA